MLLVEDDEEDLVLIQHVVHNIEEVEGQENVPHPRLRLQRGRPFQHLSDAKFIKHFRLTKQLATTVIDLVTPFVTPPTRQSALTVETKVLVALKFYGYGSYQEITGTNIFTGVSQPSVSRAITEVTNALNRPEIFHQYVKFPRNFNDLRQLKQRFQDKYLIPAVGSIDCTHVAIVPPANTPEHPEYVYVNRKHYHSLNVQLVCDDYLKILHVNAQFPGSTHDAHIWRQSTLSTLLENIHRQNPHESFFLLGDSGYPLRPWLITPIQGDVEDGTPEARFNVAQRRARNTIERCNGKIKNIFRCLCQARTLHYQPVKASQIVNACTVLYNMCVDHNIPEPEDQVPNEGLDVNVFDVPENAQNPDFVAGRNLRQNIITTFFTD